MRKAGIACALMLVAPATSISAQAIPAVVIEGPAGNPITDGIATFTVSARDFPAADMPLRLQLQVATSPSFDAPLFADTTVDGPDAVITIPRLVPAGAQIFWRAFALTARAGSVPSLITGPRTTPVAHLRLISPNNPAGQTLNTRRPRFVWSTSRVPPEFGTWNFEIRIEETATGKLITIGTTTDTTFTVAEDLEANKSYRWRVIARLDRTGEVVNVAGAGTFVILSNDSPLTTVMYDPFPSPFPHNGVSRACIWFDLSVDARVVLSVIDLRGLPVTTIFASSGAIEAGQYGRPQAGVPSGCDDRFSWDGRDRDGRFVQPGVYIIMLRAGDRLFRRRVVFQGR